MTSEVAVANENTQNIGIIDRMYRLFNPFQWAQPHGQCHWVHFSLFRANTRFICIAAVHSVLHYVSPCYVMRHVCNEYMRHVLLCCHTSQTVIIWMKREMNNPKLILIKRPKMGTFTYSSNNVYLSLNSQSMNCDGNLNRIETSSRIWEQYVPREAKENTADHTPVSKLQLNDDMMSARIYSNASHQSRVTLMSRTNYGKMKKKRQEEIK